MHARVERVDAIAPDLAALRSPPFVANPGDQVTFSFWIRSQRLRGNSLQLVMEVGLNETLLADVSSYSTSTNEAWYTLDPIPLPVTSPTNAVLIFYGVCGTSIEDAIAVDDIVVTSGGSGGGSTVTVPSAPTETATNPTTATPTTTPTTTTPTTTTPTTTTTTAPIYNCPSDGNFPIEAPYCGPAFYLCKNGGSSIAFCSNGQYFDSATQNCVPPTDSTCIKEFQCPSGSPDGFLPLYPDACETYYISCFQGGTYAQACPAGVFSPNVCKCTDLENCLPSGSAIPCNP